MHRSQSHSSSQSGSSSSSRSHSHRHHHRHHNEHRRHGSSSHRDPYSISSGLSKQYRDMRAYVGIHEEAVEYRSDDYPSYRSMTTTSTYMVPSADLEPTLTSASLGIRVEPLYPDVPDPLEIELTPRFHVREDVIWDNDIFEIMSKPKLVLEGGRETWRYTIRSKHDHGRYEVLEGSLIRIPPRRFETGAVVRLDRDKRYEVLGAAFIPQEGIWDYKIRRYSQTEGGDSKKNASEGRLSRVDSTDSHLTPPQSRHSPTRGGSSRSSPRGSFSNLMDSLFRHN
ncbi:hypothetical protein TWF694_000379 [Orbilia ellipsospora]|uniref:Uncharacterized protein n=1 Tax=Orbilia ellipsospora TaxID=2528407 RepID=A0AAV9XQ61_9PEZI